MRFLLTLMLLLGLQVLPARAEVPDFSGVASEEEFLPVEQAFRLETAAAGDNRLSLRWVIAPGYALYKSRMSAGIQESPAPGIQLASLQFLSPTVFKDDPSFGRMEVFHDEARAVLEARNVPAGMAGKPLLVEVRYQGCADAGLCYPPQTVRLPLTLVASTVMEPPVTPVVAATLRDPVKPSAAGLDEADGIAGFLGHASLPLVLLTFFALGIGLTFTPCVFPMMPILSGLIAGEDRALLTVSRAFRLSLAYVLGMAFTYALVGTLVGYFGARANVQLWLQTPAVLVGFALVFVVLSLSMFGFYELQMPALLRDRMDELARKQQGGRLTAVFIMGILSALVVSPCVSAPLAGTLVYISSTGDAVLGGLALLSLGLGMGVPLILIGTTGGRLLPKAGNWMLAVKGVFGVGMLAVAIWLLARVVPGPVTLLLWALLIGVSAVFMGALEPAEPGIGRLWKGVGAFMLLYAVFLLVGALTGQSDVRRPLAAFAASPVAAAEQVGETAEVDFVRVRSKAELREQLAAAVSRGEEVVVDVYADWCVACQDMARTTFRDPAVIAALAPMRRLQLDLSDNTPAQRELLQELKLYGPPAMLFYDRNGDEKRAWRVQSEVGPEVLLRKLQG
jgi:thiol:disulfide interchange protein DsbD